METKMSSVFLCHNSNDKTWVRELAERLTSDGVLVWLDEAELDIGDSLIEKISEGIQQMKYVAAVISTNSLQSSWVQKELSLAMSKEISGRKVTVLPLLIEECALPASLKDKLYADFTIPDNFEQEYSKLLSVLGSASAPKIINKQTTSEPPSIAKAPPQASSQTADIRIVGIIKERTHQDLEHSGLQDYYLKLSSRPPLGWEAFFNKSRQFARHSMWRKAWIEGDCVVVKCAIDELSKYHLNDLKHDVATANINYKEARLETERRSQIEAERRKEKIKERDDALDQLNFD